MTQRNKLEGSCSQIYGKMVMVGGDIDAEKMERNGVRIDLMAVCWILKKEKLYFKRLLMRTYPD